MRRIPDNTTINTDTSLPDEHKPDGIGYVCLVCKTFEYAPKESEIQKMYMRHARQSQKSHDVEDYTSAYVENEEVKKL